MYTMVNILHEATNMESQTVGSLWNIFFTYGFMFNKTQSSIIDEHNVVSMWVVFF